MVQKLSGGGATSTRGGGTTLFSRGSAKPSSNVWSPILILTGLNVVAITTLSPYRLGRAFVFSPSPPLESYRASPYM